jgi:uncharacterized protein (TIGR01777 family)
MRVAITGSSGLVGTALAERLEHSGHEVVRVPRRGVGGAPAWNPVTGWIAEGTFDGCDAVVHLGGASIGEGRWTAARKQLLRSSRIDSTRLLADHLGTLERKPRVLVCASAVGVYGDRGDETLDESAAPGVGFLADLVRDWEAEAQRAEQHGIRVANIRSGVVLAKHDGALPRLLLPVRLGVGGPLGSGRQRMPWITLDDEVRAIEFALTHEAIRGPFNAVAQSTPNIDFIRVLGRALNRPTLFPMPGLALRLLLGQMADEMLLNNQHVVARKLLDAGFMFEHSDLDAAIAAVLGTPRPATPALKTY